MMPDYRPGEPVTRPARCPECDGKAIDTLAKVFSPTTVWRCRACDETWTIRSHAASLPQPR